LGSSEEREGQAARFIAPGWATNRCCSVALDFRANAADFDRSEVLLKLFVIRQY
jgi:hypothetical protein